MTTAQLNKRISEIVDQKILEFFGDPDDGQDLQKSFLLKLRQSMRDNQKFTPHTEVLKKYELR